MLNEKKEKELCLVFWDSNIDSLKQPKPICNLWPKRWICLAKEPYTGASQCSKGKVDTNFLDDVSQEAGMTYIACPLYKELT